MQGEAAVGDVELEGGDADVEQGAVDGGPVQGVERAFERCVFRGEEAAVLAVGGEALGGAFKSLRVAVEAAEEGFAAPEFTALTGNVLTDKKLMDRLAEKAYDVVLVNIVADVIIGLAPVLPRFLGKDSTLILSGILDTRLQDVKNALTAAGLTAEEVLEDEDWRSIHAKRR